MRTFGKIVKYALYCLLGLFLLFLAAFLLFEQPVPGFLLRRITDSLSNTNYLMRADSASFRFSRGLKIYNPRLYDRRKPASRPVISATCVDLALNLRRIPWSQRTLLKSVTITELKYPRLPDGYYIPDSIEFPGHPDFQEKDEPLELKLPMLQPFHLTLIRPEILGVTPKKVSAEFVSVTPGGIRVGGIHLVWPDADAQMSVDGTVEFNLETQRVEGEVHGLARQHNIRPMLVALEITNSYAFIDGFTRVEKPVDAACAFDVNLRNNDLHIRLDLAPDGGCYKLVPLETVRGPLDIRVFVRDTYQNARITVGPLVAKLTDGSRMSGTIVYENTNDVGYVDFFNIKSNTSLSNALAVADVLNDGKLDCLVPATAPEIKLEGRLAVNPAHANANTLSGSIKFNRGTFFSIPLSNAQTDFALHGTNMSFTNVHANIGSKGAILGNGTISFPGFRQKDASFRVDMAGQEIATSDLADVFKDLRDKSGTLNGKISLHGPLSTNAVQRLGGEGSISCTKGQLARMPLFSGFITNITDLTPTITLSDAALDFTITNGTFNVTNAVVSGDMLAINSSGTYDMSKDKLAFSGNITLKKNESTFMRIATLPIRWTGEKIFGFRLKGKINNPSWSYEQNIIPKPIISRSKEIISLPTKILPHSKK